MIDPPLIKRLKEVDARLRALPSHDIAAIDPNDLMEIVNALPVMLMAIESLSKVQRERLRYKDKHGPWADLDTAEVNAELARLTQERDTHEAAYHTLKHVKELEASERKKWEAMWYKMRDERNALEYAILEHRDEMGDDRCWLDD